MITLKDITPQDYNLYVGLLTLQQKQDLIGQWYMPDSYFNPIQDNENRWVISTQEIAQCVNPDFQWVKNIPLIPFVPKPSPPIP